MGLTDDKGSRIFFMPENWYLMPSADVLDRKSLQPGVCKLFAWGALGMIGFFSEQRWFSRPKTSKGVGGGLRRRGPYAPGFLYVKKIHRMRIKNIRLFKFHFNYFIYSFTLTLRNPGARHQPPQAGRGWWRDKLQQSMHPDNAYFLFSWCSHLLESEKTDYAWVSGLCTQSIHST